MTERTLTRLRRHPIGQGQEWRTLYTAEFDDGTERSISADEMARLISECWSGTKVRLEGFKGPATIYGSNGL